MDTLVGRIERLCLGNHNHEGRNFIPETLLHNLMTESAIRTAINSLTIKSYHREELVKDIVSGGWKVFAILLLIGRGDGITFFFQPEFSHEAHIDHRLPYSVESLRNIFSTSEDDLIVLKFEQRQWEVAIPFFSPRLLPRKLAAPATILPFVNETPLGQGSFGTVWKIQLDPNSHAFPIAGCEVARKALGRRDDSDETAYENELYNLALLSHLKHPNILELFCAYSYGDFYNLVFPLADFGDLRKLLKEKRRPSGFTDLALIMAVTDLSSAISEVHYFFAEVVDMHLTGCHHDLAPRNILVHENKLLLADFGLSRFKDIAQDSASLFKGARGFYIAPECQEVDGTLQPQSITRKSDVWSFGCILAEILTYIIYGPDGVKEFEEKRKYKFPGLGLVWKRFHRGQKTPSPEVESWLESLSMHNNQQFSPVVDLVRSMLQISPKVRPSSTQTMKRLRIIAINMFADSVESSYRHVCESCRGSEPVIEYRRLQGWHWAFKNFVTSTVSDSDNELGPKSAAKTLISKYNEIIKTLGEMQDQLNSIKSATRDLQYHYYSLLRWSNTKLLNILPETIRESARKHVENTFLQTEDVELLEATRVALKEDRGDERIGTLLAVKRLTLLAEQNLLAHHENILIDPKRLTELAKAYRHHYSMAHLEETTGQEKSICLIEWLHYDARWADEIIGKELRERVESIALLLNATDTCKLPCSLYCFGFFHDGTKRAFGLAYRVPLAPGGNNDKVVTLEDILKPKTKKEESGPEIPSRPLLEDRFKLAHRLVSSVLTFHQVGWLHCNLHPANVLFFLGEDSSTSRWARTPYLIGFTRSRQNHKHAFTHGPEKDQDREAKDYQDPRYLRGAGTVRYRADFDFYSVGILLLEIGLWETLSQIKHSQTFKNVSPEVSRELLIKKRVPLLGARMGSKYMEATEACLKGDFEAEAGIGENVSGSSDRYEAIKNQILDKLAKCVV